jgi:hypothetical protein
VYPDDGGSVGESGAGLRQRQDGDGDERGGAAFGLVVFLVEDQGGGDGEGGGEGEGGRGGGGRARGLEAGDAGDFRDVHGEPVVEGCPARGAVEGVGAAAAAAVAVE